MTSRRNILMMLCGLVAATAVPAFSEPAMAQAPRTAPAGRYPENPAWDMNQPGMGRYWRRRLRRRRRVCRRTRRGRLVCRSY